MTAVPHLEQTTRAWERALGPTNRGRVEYREVSGIRLRGLQGIVDRARFAFLAWRLRRIARAGTLIALIGSCQTGKTYLLQRLEANAMVDGRTFRPSHIVDVREELEDGGAVLAIDDVDALAPETVARVLDVVAVRAVAPIAAMQSMDCAKRTLSYWLAAKANHRLHIVRLKHRGVVEPSALEIA